MCATGGAGEVISASQAELVAVDGWSGIGRHIVNGSSSWAPVGVEEEVTTPPEALLRAPPRADDGEAGMAATGTAIMVKVRGARVKQSVLVAKTCLVQLMRQSTPARADAVRAQTQEASYGLYRLFSDKFCFSAEEKQVGGGEMKPIDVCVDPYCSTAWATAG
jgi:hypothetical protein